ncbi:MAG TPA: hypothetical protein ENJ31_01760 [Anaerolineae bacterium]|nr:hypothetical protein [Anaerolineae bacterium]
MPKTVGELSIGEFEGLVEHALDRRFQVWLTQLMDAVLGGQEEGLELQPAFAASLRRSLEQAQAGEVVDLQTFREQIGR